MSLDTRGIDPQRLLPQSVEDRLLGWLRRGFGMLLLVAVLALWASLASWSVTDPSLTHATTSSPQNWLGPLGAIVSDLLLQTFGFAIVVALVAPMVWGIELLRTESSEPRQIKFGYAPLAVLACAGAMSALPMAGAWPLHHGYGGVVGDGVFKLVSKAVAVVSSNRADLVSGLLLWAVSLTLGARSVGGDIETVVANLVAVIRQRGTSRRVAVREAVGSRPQRAEETQTWNPVIGGNDAQAHRDTYRRDIGPRLAMPPDDWTSRVADLGALRPTSGQTYAAPASIPGLGVSALHPSDCNAPNMARRDAAPLFSAQFIPDQSAPADFIQARFAPALGSPLQAMPSEPYDLRDAHQAFDHGVRHGDQTFSPINGTDSIHGDGPRGREFDSSTDDASVAIAQRFAPAASDAATPLQSSTPSGPLPIAKVGDMKSVSKLAQKAAGLMGGIGRRPAQPTWSRPSINLLKRATAAKAGPEFTQTVMRGNARLLEDVLADFGVKGEVKDIRPGPVVTLYELEPARGTKSSRVIGLADDMARSMSVVSVRAAVVPGRNAIGLELPNLRREPVMLREILESDAYKLSDATLPIALGKGIGGEPIVADLARMPHLLVAGTTGSGKSVGVNAFILSLLYRHSPEDCRLLMIDPKMLELSVYNGIPHLLTPVVTDPQKAVAALNWAVSEMEERYKRMASLSVRNIDVFNNRVRNAAKRGERLSRTVQTGFDPSGQAVFENQKMDLEALPRIVIVVDEFADLMIVAGKEVEQAVQRLAQMARAAGIHLIMATQRPSVDIITGTIKANFPTRISFKVTSKIDSRTILNEQGAEQLLGQGDMLYSTGAGQITRVHGPYVSDEEVEEIASALRRQGPPVYVDGIIDSHQSDDIATGAREPADGDLYDRAVAIVLRDRKASTSYLQRRLSIGYNRAADLIERMERDGLISAASHVGRREILVAGSGSADAA